MQSQASRAGTLCIHDVARVEDTRRPESVTEGVSPNPGFMNQGENAGTLPVAAIQSPGKSLRERCRVCPIGQTHPNGSC